MHKINICLDSKIWIRNVPKIENKIRQILKKSIMTEKLFFKKKNRNYSFINQVKKNEIS